MTYKKSVADLDFGLPRFRIWEVCKLDASML